MVKLKPTTGNLAFLLSLAVAIVVVFPLLTIWSLNTLFPVLNIPYTIETWLAAYLIPAAFKNEISFKKD